MSTVDAVGCAQITRCVFASLEIPDAHPVTDCASLCDAIHKDGYSKLPSERRLLLDLVGLKESLEEEISNEFVTDDQRSQLPLFWVPTDQQEAHMNSAGSLFKRAIRLVSG
eukprot:7829452-Pyramimonas_sp.AAC.1